MQAGALRGNSDGASPSPADEMQASAILSSYIEAVQKQNPTFFAASAPPKPAPQGGSARMVAKRTRLESFGSEEELAARLPAEESEGDEEDAPPPSSPPPADEDKSKPLKKRRLGGWATPPASPPSDAKRAPACDKRRTKRSAHAALPPAERMTTRSRSKRRLEEESASTRDSSGDEDEEASVKSKVDLLWEKLLDRFVAAEEDEAMRRIPSERLLRIVDIITCALEENAPVRAILRKLAAAFAECGSQDLMRDFVHMLMQLNIDKAWLARNGIYDERVMEGKSAPQRNRRSVAHEDEDEEEDEGEEEEEEEDGAEEEDEEGEEEYLEDDDDIYGEPKRSQKRRRTARSAAKKAAASQQDEPTSRAKSTAGKRERSSTSSSASSSTPSGKKRIRRSPDKWNDEEDMKLIALVQKYGVNTKKWRIIAEELGTTKTSAKCAQHWRRVLAPNIHKGSWSAEEEEKLLAGVKAYGLTQWTIIARDIPGRTDIQCRYHYLRQKNSRKAAWSAEEDALLRQLRDKFGSKWLEVSDEMALHKLRRTPRTALECKERWAKIGGC